MALLEIFVSKEKYLNRINQLDVQLTRLNSIAERYQTLFGELKTKVVDSEDDNFDRMYTIALQEAKALKIQIQNAQTTRALLQKTVEQMDQNQTLVEGVLEDIKTTTTNTIAAAEDAAKLAAAAAEVASIIV